MEISCYARWLILLLLGAPADDLKLVKPLPVPTFSWPIPSEVLRVDNAELSEITRITKSIGVFAEAPQQQAAVALQVAQPHNAKLAVMFRPWFEPTVTDPTLPAAQSEFSVTWSQWYAGPAKAIQASTYKPQVVCLVDTESFDCREEPKRAKCSELYASYDAFIRRISGCTEVYWYGFGEVAAPADPNGYAFQPWAVSFAGMKSVGWEAYGVGEIVESRVMSHKAKAYGDSLNIPTSVWASVGCGQRYDWNPFKTWTWTADQAYSRELGAELFGKWWRERPQRFHAPPATVIFYPSLLDLRIVDSEWKNRLAFLKGATE